MGRMVIGIGNPFRCDDAVGLEVARRIRSIPSHERTSGFYEFMDLWEGSDDVVIVDGMQSGAPAGTIKVFDLEEGPLPYKAFASTQSAGLRDAVELARRLGRLPARLTVYAIEIDSMKPGFQMTSAVRKAAEQVVTTIDHP